MPKILPVDVPLRTSVREPQLVEQLVEVPTTISFSSLQRIAEQNVDIPVVGGSGTGGSLSGFLPGQHYSMTAEQIVDNPVPRRSFSGDLQGFPPGQSSSKRTANKIADSPFIVQRFRPICRTRQIKWYLAPFTGVKKSAKIPRTQGSELGAQSSSWTP